MAGIGHGPFRQDMVRPLFSYSFHLLTDYSVPFLPLIIFVIVSTLAFCKGKACFFLFFFIFGFLFWFMSVDPF